MSVCDTTVASYESLLAQELVGAVALSIVRLVCEVVTRLLEVTVERLGFDDDDVAVVVRIGRGIVVALLDKSEVEEEATKSANDVVLKEDAVDISVSLEHCLA